MGRKAAGRMINQDVSLSAKIANLSPEPLALFCLLIPHFNSHGKMLADPYAIKGNVCPLVPWLTIEKIKSCLTEISNKTNVKWWCDKKGLHYLHSLNWHEHQDLRTDRLGIDRLPDYAGKKMSEGDTEGEFQENSGSSPGVLPSEVEVEEEVEGKDEAFNPHALRLAGLLAEHILANNPNYAKLKAGKQEKAIRRWAGDIDKMIRLDERPVKEAESILHWCQQDQFWKANILSGAKLREKYDQLLLQIDRRGENQGLEKQVIPMNQGRRVY